MSARPYHKRYHSDALAGFMALSLEERGAYQTLLDLIYDHQGPIADNERLLAGYMGCSVRKWRALRDQLIAKRKIHLNSDGLITNLRAEKELENDAKTTRKLAENGSSGGRKKSENAKLSNDNNERDQAPLEQNSSLYQKPEARSQKPESLSRTEVGERRARTNDPPLNANLAAVMKAGGMISPPPDAHLVREWLALPGMELERDIIPIVARVAERKRERDSRPPFKLLLFDAAVREHHATEQAEIERLRRIPMQIAETERLQREADEAEERERRAAVGR